MKSQALEILELSGGETIRYIPKVGGPRNVLAVVDPMRRVDALGNQDFLTKTYEVWIVNDPVEGLTEIVPNADTFALKLQATDTHETLFKITKIYPERDRGLSDRTSLWHLEAVT